jgi:plasmid stabilization system protein ParE
MKVRFTRTAQRDLAQIHAYINQDSPDIASRFIARLIERSRALAENPLEGRETDEPNARVIVAPRLRYLIFTLSQRTRFTSPTSAIHHAVVHVAGVDSSYPAPISGIASSRSNR